jgi:hypothetical protein
VLFPGSSNGGHPRLICSPMGHSSTNPGPYFRLFRVGVFTDWLLPLDKCFAVRAPFEFPLDLTQWLEKIDHKEKDRKQGAEKAPADDVSPPVGSQAAADHTRYKNYQKQKKHRLDVFYHGIHRIFIMSAAVRVSVIPEECAISSMSFLSVFVPARSIGLPVMLPFGARRSGPPVPLQFPPSLEPSAGYPRRSRRTGTRHRPQPDSSPSRSSPNRPGWR